MTYRILITQTLCGCVDIEAEDLDTALEIADSRFNRNGKELPDMDDFQDLEFEAVEGVAT